MANEMLKVSNLTIKFNNNGINTAVVDDFSMSMKEREIFGIVGESGSGKTMTASAIDGILPSDAQITGGSISFLNNDILKLKEIDKRKICGSKIGMIFQEPLTSLNPVYKIGRQIEENLLLHTDLSAKSRKERAINMLKLVEISDADKVYSMYPHQLSGGMRQRVMIASAIIHSPKLLIADEPTTALDVCVQAKIIDLLKKINIEMGVGIIFISHNLLVIKKLCSRVIVMQRAKVVEFGDTLELFENPSEEYTKKLISSLKIWNK